MDWQAHVESIWAREQAEGRLTPQEVTLFQRRLDLLAFNMSAVGQNEGAKTAAAIWLWHLPRHRPRSLRHATGAEQVVAWWRLGVAAGFLREDEDRLAFVDVGLQEYFCLHFCQSRPLDAKLLRLAARESFASIWRRWAAQDPTLIERLIDRALGIGQARGCAYAARVLRLIGDSRPVERFLAALTDVSAAVQMRAAQALRILDDPRACDLLIARLVQLQPPAQTPVIEALGSFGLPVLPALLTLLRHPDPLVILASSTRAGKAVLLRAVESLGRFGEAAIPVLITLLSYPDDFVIKASISGLGATGSVQAVEPLIILMSGQAHLSTFFQPWADDPAYIQLMIKVMSGGVQLAPIPALVRLGGIAVPTLMDALSYEDPFVRRGAARALGQIREAGRERS